MKIYDKEKKDGIADLVKTQSSIAYYSPASVLEPEDVLGGVSKTSPEVEKLLAKSNPDQIDLYYLESVLVSTGWNKNDDVFLTKSTWNARNTPEDKQFNFMHDENDIIGHITGSYIADNEGNIIETDVAPNQFDIITQAVLYNSWTDPENRERMEKIISEIENGDWFVSMECLFSDFDYALVDSVGKNQLLERDGASAFLTKHLRAYGGEGEYEGYKIGRALKNISFTGKGLVSNPANPRSVILNSTKAFDITEEDKLTIFSGEITMSNDNVSILEQQVIDLKNGLQDAQAENEGMRKDIEAAKDKEFAATVETFEVDLGLKDESLAVLQEEVKASKDRVIELEDALAKKDEDLSEAVSKIEAQEAEAKLSARRAALVDTGAEEGTVEETLAAFAEATDDMFDQVVALMTQKAEWPPNKDKDKKKKDEDKDKDKDKDKEAKASEKVEEAEETEASEETFENVESSEATLVEASNEEDELESTRANVAQWLADNVLSSK